MPTITMTPQEKDAVNKLRHLATLDAQKLTLEREIAALENKLRPILEERDHHKKTRQGPMSLKKRNRDTYFTNRIKPLELKIEALAKRLKGVMQDVRSRDKQVLKQAKMFAKGKAA